MQRLGFSLPRLGSGAALPWILLTLVILLFALGSAVQQSARRVVPGPVQRRSSTLNLLRYRSELVLPGGCVCLQSYWLRRTLVCAGSPLKIESCSVCCQSGLGPAVWSRPHRTLACARCRRYTNSLSVAKVARKRRQQARQQQQGSTCQIPQSSRPCHGCSEACQVFS